MDLSQHAATYGLEIDEAVRDTLERYLGIMLAKNEQVNLTAIKDYDQGIILHLLDSLLYNCVLDKYLERHISITMLDMGCGAGMPGIPMALANASINGVLCDATKKKVDAVNEFLDQLNLTKRLTAVQSRIEDLPRVYGGRFDLVVARALSSLPVLLEYASPLLIKNGLLIVSKGRPETSEVVSGARAAKLVGMEQVGKEVYELPNDMGHREFYIYRKVGQSKVKLPRKPGMATANPLA